ncbi:MAG: alpha/beta hydrolase [Candidatus Babeliales bacterium]
MFVSVRHYMQYNKGKIIAFIVCIAYVFLLYRGQQEIAPLCHWNVTRAQTLLDLQTKYLNGGRLEYVTFYSQESADTATQFERRGILYIHPHARATIVMCHGFMCNKFDSAFIRQSLFGDYNVLMFDFRAHGENTEQQCCTFGRDEALDVHAAVAYAKSRADVGQLPCICYGFSMGAVAAILAQQEDDTLFDALILDCPYDESQNILKHSIQRLYISIFGFNFDIPGRALLERFAFNTYVQSILKSLLKTVAQLDATATNTYIYPASPVQAVKSIHAPCFFIHCKNDEKVPVGAAQKIFANAAGYKRLWITNGRRHFDSLFYNPDKYRYKVNTFITDVLDNKVRAKKKAKILYDEPIEQPTIGFCYD